jgi:tetratricopeptide (TPR) repeat protein
MSRLEQLLQFVKEEPEDPFNIYAVAMEYLKLESEKAIPFLEKLVNQHAGYVPTYYTYAKLLQARKNYVRAKQLFETGIAVATNANDAKAIAELRNALSELEFDME